MALTRTASPERDQRGPRLLPVTPLVRHCTRPPQHWSAPASASDDHSNGHLFASPVLLSHKPPPQSNSFSSFPSSTLSTPDDDSDVLLFSQQQNHPHHHLQQHQQRHHSLPLSPASISKSQSAFVTKVHQDFCYSPPTTFACILRLLLDTFTTLQHSVLSSSELKSPSGELLNQERRTRILPPGRIICSISRSVNTPTCSTEAKKKKSLALQEDEFRLRKRRRRKILQNSSLSSSAHLLTTTSPRAPNSGSSSFSSSAHHHDVEGMPHRQACDTLAWRRSRKKPPQQVKMLITVALCLAAVLVSSSSCQRLLPQPSQQLRHHSRSPSGKFCLGTCFFMHFSFPTHPAV